MANTKITTNVIADDAITSDQLGGDLTMPGHVSLADNKEIRVGTGNDLVIKHSGSHTTLTNTTGNLTLAGDAVYIANAANSEYLAQFIADGAASLRFNNVEELATVSGGVYIPNELGIGTNSPTSPLHISSATNRTLLLDYTAGSGSYSWASFKQSGTEKFRIFGDYTAGYLSFYNETRSAHHLTLASDGKVGIGTAVPAAGLMVQTSSDGTALSGDDTNVAYFHNQESTAGHSYGVRVRAGSNATDYAFRVDTLATNSVFEVEGTGNVGIGTASPASLLHLLAPANTDAELKICTDDGETSRLGLYEEAAGALHGAFIQYTGGNVDKLEIGHRNSGTDSVWITVLDTTGKVGIGTTDPVVSSTVIQTLSVPLCL
jgi:hypothetical protein